MSLEEARAKSGFQSLDPPRHRRLADLQLAACAGQATMAADGKEVADIVPVHHSVSGK